MIFDFYWIENYQFSQFESFFWIFLNILKNYTAKSEITMSTVQ